MSLSFEELREKNLARCESAFHQDIKDWTEPEWAAAMAGEGGEASEAIVDVLEKALCTMKLIAKIGKVCDSSKKLHRGDDIDLSEIGKEIADVVVYADLLATRFGFVLGDLVKDKFNEVSDRVGSDIKIEGLPALLCVDLDTENICVLDGGPGPMQLPEGYTNMARGSSLTGVIRKLDPDEVIASDLGVPLADVEKAFKAGHTDVRSVNGFLAPIYEARQKRPTPQPNPEVQEVIKEEREAECGSCNGDSYLQPCPVCGEE